MITKPAIRLSGSSSRRALIATAVAILCTTSVREAAAQANVLSVGDVSPAERPFIPGDQGVPVGGSSVFTTGVNFFGDPVDPSLDPNFDPSVKSSGRFTDEDGNTVGQFNYERSANIEVGRYATGQMLMSGGAVLRFGDLIIGGDTGENTQANNLNFDTSGFLSVAGSQIPAGSGTVEIAGNGTVFNNHPLIVDPQFQDASNPEATTFDIPVSYNPTFLQGGVDGDIDRITDIARPGTVTVIGGGNGGAGEFDLYVGLQSSGVLRIAEGGRAEIRDGAFIGMGPTAVGTVSVDGIGSYLGVYGMKNPFSGGGGGAETIIGLYGQGNLEITNGGRVDSFNRAALGAIDGAGDEGNAFDQGGHGTVLVEGAGSVWRVMIPTGASGTANASSALSVGEFSRAGTIDARFDELLSETDAYLAEDGRGTLRIRDGGLVAVLEDGLTNNDDDASMRIGLFGELQLNGGRIVVGDRLDNDGLIRTGDNLNGVDSYGDGVIETGSFLNSPAGQVRVRAGENLQIRSLADDNQSESTMAGMTTTTYQYANAGKIFVLGDQALGKAEIEFIREQDTSQNGTPLDNRFKNLFFDDVPNQTATPADVRGKIFAQDANLFFRSDFLNEADVDFIGGDNVVTGIVENATTGRISALNGSHVTFTDDVVNNGIVLLNDDSTVTFASNFTNNGFFVDLNPVPVTVGGDLEMAGVFEFAFEGGPTEIDFTRMSVVGDATFSDTSFMTINVNALDASVLQLGDTFEVLSVLGGVVDNGLFVLPTFLPGPGNLAFVARVFDAAFDDQAVILEVVDQASVVLNIAGDFNGDGVVDAADYAFWRNNLGGSEALLNGAGDGSGVIDVADLDIWRDNVGMTAPSPLSASTAVPEPASLGLLLAACSATIAARVRRS